MRAFLEELLGIIGLFALAAGGIVFITVAIFLEALPVIVLVGAMLWLAKFFWSGLL